MLALAPETREGQIRFSCREALEHEPYHKLLSVTMMMVTNAHDVDIAGGDGHDGNDILIGW